MRINKRITESERLKQVSELKHIIFPKNMEMCDDLYHIAEQGHLAIEKLGDEAANVSNTESSKIKRAMRLTIFKITINFNVFKNKHIEI